jgi:hypothetical protein
VPTSETRVTIQDIHNNRKATLDGASSYNQVFLAEYADSPGDWTACKKMEFERGETYAVDFERPYVKPSSSSICQACMFQPGVDHMAIGLRLESDLTERIEGVPDYLFYPPQVDNAPTKLRHQEFSIPILRDAQGVPLSASSQTSVQACVTLTFAFYSQMVGGSFQFTNFKVYRKNDEAYHFLNPSSSSYYEYTPSIPAKAAVKAFELQMEVDSKGEVSRSKTVIPVPNNGTDAKKSGS